MRRLFFAVDLSDEAREALADWTEFWKRSPVPSRTRVTWSSPEDAHITLRFLGAVEEERLPFVLAAGARAAAVTSSFELALGKPGNFGRRVLWIGVEGSGLHVLANLGRVLEAEARAMGFEPEERPFQPHLTVGRVREGKNPRRPPAEAIPPVAFSVRELVLFESVAERVPGARYAKLATWPLSISAA